MRAACRVHPESHTQEKVSADLPRAVGLPVVPRAPKLREVGWRFALGGALTATAAREAFAHTGNTSPRPQRHRPPEEQWHQSVPCLGCEACTAAGAGDKWQLVASLGLHAPPGVEVSQPECEADDRPCPLETKRRPCCRKEAFVFWF